MTHSLCHGRIIAKGRIKSIQLARNFDLDLPTTAKLARPAISNLRSGVAIVMTQRHIDQASGLGGSDILLPTVLRY
jgi:hypothetical protein